MSETNCKSFGTTETRAFATRECCDGPRVLASFVQRGESDDPSAFTLSTTAHLTPAQAREFAQALLNAADFAEGKEASDADRR